MVLSFFGIVNDVEAHSDAGCHSNTLSLHNLSTSLMMVSLVFLVLGKLGHDRVIHLSSIRRRPV